MESKKKRIILKSIEGAVERSRQRAQLRAHRKAYYSFRNLLQKNLITDFPAAIAFLAYHKFPHEVDMRFGFSLIKVGEYPVLMFNRDGRYAGHDGTMHKAPQDRHQDTVLLN